MTTPDPSCKVANLRKYAKRRGYKLRKKYGKDRYYLVDLDTGHNVVAEDSALGDEKYFSCADVKDYLSFEKPVSRRANEAE